MVSLVIVCSSASGQQQPVALQSPSTATQPEPLPQVANPYEAYDQGLYDQALQGFSDLQVEYPEDPEVALNVGSAHYHMRNYQDADRAFSQAALATDLQLREEAIYNLANSAYRQGRLEQAVGLYKAALEIDPDDEDAKFNLEFVRDEIRRRHEEAQKRQDQQPQQQQQDQQGQDQQPQGDQDEQQPQGGQDQKPEQRQPEGGQDSDRDGLPDSVETEGENPTDPGNPDTDGDSLPDGAEDTDRNGRLDPGETDPNNPDSDGDGLSDAEEAMQSGQGGEAEPSTEGGLTPEQAERYLQALEEGRPVRRQPQAGRRSRNRKDW